MLVADSFCKVDVRKGKTRFFVHIHLPGSNPTPDAHKNVLDPSFLRTNRSALLLVCLKLPGSIQILNPPVLPVDRHLLLSEELRVPAYQLGELIFK